jgi:hypothetical protein
MKCTQTDNMECATHAPGAVGALPQPSRAAKYASHQMHRIFSHILTSHGPQYYRPLATVLHKINGGGASVTSNALAVIAVCWH